MTELPSVSVIVVSHGRPALLRRALIGIGQLFYRPFEVVVVADEQGLQAISDLPFADRIKTAPQDEPNISRARNAGIRMSSGQVLAFIDDDAVPEPTWLNHLVSPLSEPDIAATTGTVLGRNGISVQWACRLVDSLGVAHAAPEGSPPDGLAVKLEGTNMAMRRDVVVGMGGFDEGFAFYLDETDLAYRFMKAGHQASFAPLATVHHGFAASSRRTRDRVPLSLFQIGQSTALYLTKHASPDQIGEGKGIARSEQAGRVDRLIATGVIARTEGRRLLQTLEAGLEAGSLQAPIMARGFESPPAFLSLDVSPAPTPALLTGRWFSRSRLERRARALAQEGCSVTLMVFDHTVRAHRVEFTSDGVWLQKGGLFGKSVRYQPRFTVWSLRGRIRSEVDRLTRIRWIPAGAQCDIERES